MKSGSISRPRAAARSWPRNGALADEKGQSGPVDEWSHFVNVLMLDRHGKRINRRNPQDIFTPLYDHQIPPGAAQVRPLSPRCAGGCDGPDQLAGAVALSQVRPRVHEDRPRKHGPCRRLPIVDMCEDEVTLPVEGGRPCRRRRQPSRCGSAGTITASAVCWKVGGRSDEGALQTGRGGLPHGGQSRGQGRRRPRPSEPGASTSRRAV